MRARNFHTVSAFDALSNCASCSGDNHELSVRLRMLYSHTACASAFMSTHHDDAVLSFCPIVPAVLYSLASVFHTACASHCGDSGVNGDISPVINPSAVIVAVAVSIVCDVPLENAIAHSEPVPVSEILLEPVQYNAQFAFHDSVIVIQHVQFHDTTSDNCAFADNVIIDSPIAFTHITAAPFASSWFSENHTMYQDFLGIIHQLVYPVGNHHWSGIVSFVYIALSEPLLFHCIPQIVPAQAWNFHGDLWMTL